MKKEKKALDKVHAPLQNATVVKPVPVKETAARPTDNHYQFTRYAFDSNGGGYQGL